MKTTARRVDSIGSGSKKTLDPTDSNGDYIREKFLYQKNSLASNDHPLSLYAVFTSSHVGQHLCASDSAP